MNLRDLHYLVAVAELKHFGKAAEHCFVSQPALSMQLKKLEEYLGVQLFERSNKRVMITPVGQEIVARAQHILQESKEMIELAKHFQNPLVGRLTLGAFPTLAPYFFPKLVPEIKVHLPEISLFIVEDKTETLIQKLKQGEIDGAFLAIPLPVEEEGLEYEALFTDTFYLAVYPNHPLAKRASVTYADVQNQSLLLLEDGHCLRDQALDVCALTGAKEHPEFRATSLETLRQMTAYGTGITLIPDIARRDHDGIVYLPFKAQPPSRRIGLFWRKTSARKEGVKSIAKLCK